MKNLVVKTPRIVLHSALFLSLAGAATNSWAATCVPNADVTANCGDLVINTPGATITVGPGIVVTGSNAVWDKVGALGTIFTNNGTINGSSLGLYDGYNHGTYMTPPPNVGTFDRLTNNGIIHGDVNGLGIIDGGITTLTNSSGATISGRYYGVANDAGTITTLTNEGLIVGGSIAGGFADIRNTGGTLTTLNNAQGGSTPLTYKDTLPVNYNIIIHSPTDYGKLQGNGVSGTMTFGIDPSSTVARTTTYQSVLSGIDASELTGTSGMFAGYAWQLILQSGSSTVWDLLYDPVIRATFASNASGFASGAAGMLDSLSGNTTDPGMSAAITSLQNMSASQQNAALSRVAPETNRSSESVSSKTLDAGLDMISDRLDHVRGQGYVASAMDNLLSGKLLVASAGSLRGLIGPDESRNHSFWFKGFGVHANQSEKGGYAGYDSNTWGGSFGADAMLKNNWLVGAAFTYAYTDVDMNNYRSGDGTHISTYQTSLYTSHDFGAWYLDGMLSYAQQGFDGTRDTMVTGVAHSDYDGHQWASRLMAGMPLSLGATTTLTPMAGVEWNRFNRDSYTETGAGALSMSVDGQTVNRVRSVLGAKLATEWTLSNGTTMMPSIRTSWRHEFNHDGVDTSAEFVGGGTAFSTPGQALPGNSYNLGATLAFQKSRTFTVSMLVDGWKASGYTAVSGQITGQWLF
jgi:outer membrane autotransporter protein